MQKKRFEGQQSCLCLKKTLTVENHTHRHNMAGGRQAH